MIIGDTDAGRREVFCQPGSDRMFGRSGARTSDAFAEYTSSRLSTNRWGPDRIGGRSGGESEVAARGGIGLYNARNMLTSGISRVF